MALQPVYLLGAMSGTSTDGVDVVLLETDETRSIIKYLGMHSLGFTTDLHDRLLQLQNPRYCYDKQDPFDLLLTARRDLSRLYAQCANTLIKQFSLPASQISAYGVHGQTIRHNPEKGYTFQVIDAALVAELTQIRVISDLRSADVAAGGQGAPLVCPFHLAWLNNIFGQALKGTTAILNLGGFSNLTLVGETSLVVAGGDCGPANLYLDWCAKKYFNVDFDDEGQRAQLGDIHSKLLAELFSHPYFLKPWPASTGREDFNIEWLENCLAKFEDIKPNDLLRTLLELSAQAVARCLTKFYPGTLYFCGGGSKNKFLIERLNELLLPNWLVVSFDQLGLPAQAVEAAAFAWLAGRYDCNEFSNCKQVTGATKEVVLGQATAIINKIKH